MMNGDEFVGRVTQSTYKTAVHDFPCQQAIYFSSLMSSPTIHNKISANKLTLNVCLFFCMPFPAYGL